MYSNWLLYALYREKIKRMRIKVQISFSFTAVEHLGYSLAVLYSTLDITVLDTQDVMLGFYGWLFQSFSTSFADGPASLDYDSL